MCKRERERELTIYIYICIVKSIKLPESRQDRILNVGKWCRTGGWPVLIQRRGVCTTSGSGTTGATGCVSI